MFSYTHYRGRPYRGAPRNTGYSSLSQSNRPTHADLLGGLTNRLASIARPVPDPADKQEGEIKIKDFKTVGSYSWVEDADVPTIVIPGEPPIWSPPSASFQCQQDNKPSYIDQNRAHLSKHPMEPLLQSVKVLDPAFDLSSMDIITSRNNLRKLLRFVLGTFMEDYFRIDAELVGDTLVLMRWEAAQVERPSTFRGYGANFKDRCTKAVRDDAPINHRSVTYDLGGLKLVVGCHVDAQWSKPAVKKEDTAEAKATSSKAFDPDDLSALFTSMSVKKTDSVKTFEDSTVRYIKDGTMCSDSSTVELHTRSGARDFEYFEAYAQMVLSQTQYLVVARHNRGYFNMPAERRPLDDPFFNPEKTKLQDAFKRLIIVLREMKKAVKEKANGCPVAFVFEGSTLDVFPVKHADDAKLPPRLRKLFDKPADT